MARVSSKQRETKVADDLNAHVAEYAHLKKQIDDMTRRQKQLRDELMEAIQADGYEDADGHWWLDLDTPVDGIESIKRERRTKQQVDEEAAEELLTERDLWKACTKQVRILDEDAVMSALWDKKLTEDDIDVIYPTKIIWALHVK